MKPTYTYDEIYGTFLSKNREDTKRVYFIIECQYYTFYKWMYKYGWNKARASPCQINGLNGYKVTLIR